MSAIQNYNLPDAGLLTSAILPAIAVWQPDQVYVVLGRSNQPETSVFSERIEADDVVLLKRPSGGESVVLTPSTLVVAFAVSLQQFPVARRFFEFSNSILLEAFNKLGLTGLSQRGISDISFEGMKIVGSSMYKGADRLFYHAVINVAELPGTIAWYLKHPPREPDYRGGRKHEAFITSLRELGFEGSVDEVATAVRTVWQNRVMQPGVSV